jgi:hypothetical protein
MLDDAGERGLQDIDKPESPLQLLDLLDGMVAICAGKLIGILWTSAPAMNAPFLWVGLSNRFLEGVPVGMCDGEARVMLGVFAVLGPEYC